jgi:hypothetical protein
MTVLHSKGWSMVPMGSEGLKNPMVHFDGVPGLNPRTLAFQHVKVDGIQYMVLSVLGLPRDMADATGQGFSLVLQRTLMERQE